MRVTRAHVLQIWGTYVTGRQRRKKLCARRLEATLLQEARLYLMRERLSMGLQRLAAPLMACKDMWMVPAGAGVEQEEKRVRNPCGRR